MPITASLNITPYSQTALVFISLHLENYTATSIQLDLRVERSDIYGTSGTSNVAFQRTRIGLRNTGDGSVTLPVYPLPANSNVKIKLYLVQNSSTYTLLTETTFRTSSISTSARYLDMPKVNAYTPEGWVKMEETDKQNNARIFYNVLSADGWTDQSIASILAFAEHYGDVNPNSNLKYLMPWALENKPTVPWNYYIGDTYYTNRSDNIEQFGGYYGADSSAGTEFLTPYTDQRIAFYGGARNGFLQVADRLNCFPRDVWGRIGAFMPFLPVYKQHYVDILDKYLPYHWYATPQAFTVEQYLQYLKYYKTDREEKLSLFDENSELQTFTDFTISTHDAPTLVLELYRSINKTKMYPFDEYGSYAGYVPNDNDKNLNNATYWLPKYALKWYNYIQTIKPKPSKRHKMPIWEYLRYTI